MKIAITGASGKTGYRISEEAVKKGYKVRQIIRKNSKVSAGLERLETIRVSLDKKGELDAALCLIGLFLVLKSVSINCSASMWGFIFIVLIYIFTSFKSFA